MTQQDAAVLQQAQQALKQNDKMTARRLLQTAVRQQPHNHVAWLLLASVTADPHTALAYVEEAAKIHPGSPTVQKALAWAHGRIPPEAPAQPAPHRRRLLWLAGTAVLLLLLIAGWSAFRPLAAPAPHGSQSTTATPTLFSHAIAAANDAQQPTMPPDSQVASAAPSVVSAAASVATPAPYIPAKQISHDKEAGAHVPRATWTLTPTPTPTPSPTSTPPPTFVAPQDGGPVSRPFGVGPNERWVDVNLTTQTLVAYEGNTPVLTTLISSGTWQYPTVTGQFRIYLTYQSQTMDGRRLGYDYYLENVPYVLYFYQDYALHGTFWHNNFGTPMSHGCVNMETSDAAWMYNFVSIGTVVNVHY